MYSEENAIRSMIVKEFQKVLPEKILVKTFIDKILPALTDTDQYNLVYNSYEFSDDFYVLKNTVTPEERTEISNILYDIRYSAWYTEFPDAECVNNDINIAILQDTYKDNLENQYIEQKLTVFVFGAVDCYMEMLHIAKIIKKIRITRVIAESERQIKGFQFEKLISAGSMSTIPNSYIDELFGKAYYVRQINFELVFFEI